MASALKDLAPADAVIEKLIQENRPFYLQLLATRCVEALWLLGSETARRQLKHVTDCALSCERGFDNREPTVDPPPAPEPTYQAIVSPDNGHRTLSRGQPMGEGDLQP
jgi:hypothetical protein